MKDSDTLALLRAAVPAADGQVWADVGAGTGAFTRALAALVGSAGRVFAVDTDDGALATVRTWAQGRREGAAVTTVHADLARPLPVPPLDGEVMANVLHFVEDAAGALALVTSRLRPGGRLVLVEYEGRRPSRWVPHPVSAARFRHLAAGAGLAPPAVVATRPSLYGGDIYVAVTTRTR